MLVAQAAYGRGGALLVDVAAVAEAIEGTDGDQDGGRAAIGGNGDGEILCLGLKLQGDVAGEIVVDAAADAVDIAVSSLIENGLLRIEEACAGVVDFATSVEEVDIGMDAIEGLFDLETAEEALLRVNLTAVDGDGATGFQGGKETVVDAVADVNAGGEAGVFAATDVGFNGGETAEGVELEGADRSEEAHQHLLSATGASTTMMKMATSIHKTPPHRH